MGRTVGQEVTSMKLMKDFDKIIEQLNDDLALCIKLTEPLPYADFRLVTGMLAQAHDEIVRLRREMNDRVQVTKQERAAFDRFRELCGHDTIRRGYCYRCGLDM